MVLRKSGRVDSRRFRVKNSKQMKGINRKVGSFFIYNNIIYLCPKINAL